MSPSEPRTAVLAIGDELLSGEVLDTNLSSIAEAFGEHGLTISFHMTVPDDVEAIVRAVMSIAGGHDIVVVTGGLGPTSDDLTTEAVAKAAGRALVFQPHIAEKLEAFFGSLGRSMPEENLKQAYLPEGALEIPAGGTAPGFMLEIEGALMAVLPGVPREMEAMLANAVIPEVRRRFPSTTVTLTRRLMTFGRGESDVASLLADRIGSSEVRYGFLVRSGPIIVKMTASGDSESAVMSILAREEQEARERLGDLVYGTDGAAMESVLGEMLRSRGWTLATAESITAGMVSSRLAEVPGSSDYLLGGVVAYTVEEKMSVLGVPEGLLRDGAVSAVVAEAMARGARDLFSSDIALATTGVAGPGAGGERKPPGTVAIALAHPEGEISTERRLPGDRAMVRSIATTAVLNMARLYLAGVRLNDTSH